MTSFHQFCWLIVPLVFVSCSTWADAATPRAVIVAQNSGTEITDLLIPFAILGASGISVEIVATSPGPVNLMNGLEVLNLRTINDVDLDDLSLVVVPAVHEPEDPVLGEWLAAANTNSTLVASICDGVEVLASARLLDGHKATGHFYSAGRRLANHPQVNWVENKRYVHDANLITTAGVSASAPASIYLAKLLVGQDVANGVAKHFGIDLQAGTTHNTADFSIGVREVFVGVRNFLLGLRKKKYNLLVGKTTEEYSLAFAVDALGRTMRASVSVDAPNATFETRLGLQIRGKPAHASPDFGVDLGLEQQQIALKSVVDAGSPHAVVANVFAHIESEYGLSTARFVGLQLELPNRGVAP